MYSDQPVRADSIPYVSRYWHAYGFAGFGDYVGTARDLLKFEQALDKGKLSSRTVMEESLKPFKMKKGEDHPLLYGLGWMRGKNASLGAIVYHGGGSVGLSCVIESQDPPGQAERDPQEGIREPTVTGDLPEDDGSVSMTGPRPAALGLRISLVRAGPRLQRNKRVVRGEDGREETARPVEGDLLLEPARIR